MIRPNKGERNTMMGDAPQSDRSRLFGPNRRQLLGGIAAAPMVLGFDKLSGWVGHDSAQASTTTSVEGLPPLDGSIFFDKATREADAHDQGNIVEQMPWAVLRPGSVNDIARMIQYCGPRGIKVAARGQHHTTFGQGLVSGLLIENRCLQQIHSINPTYADVDAGVLWTELLHAAFAQGLTPPVFTGYTDLSIAGTLSVGGVSARNDQGLQVDRVQELEVVTGTGEIVTCSESENRDLFEVMLGGLGQCGIITRAKVDLVAAMQMARTYVLHYTDNAAFFRDLRTLLGRGELDGVYNRWTPDGTTLTYGLTAVAFFDPDAPPDDEYLLRDLSPAAAEPPTDLPYPDWVTQVNTLIELYKTTLDWDNLHKPWFDVWLPDTTVEQYVADLVSTLGPTDIGAGGFFLLFPQRHSTMTRPFVRLPAADGSDLDYLLDVLTVTADKDAVPAMVNRNDEWFQKARAAGGTRYPIGAMNTDWPIQYGDMWAEFQRLKELYDPHDILTPGPGIF
jgi:cytokinin dehydrogenase